LFITLLALLVFGSRISHSYEMISRTYDMAFRFLEGIGDAWNNELNLRPSGFSPASMCLS